jgi:FKBP-type peptidyl-prolyl cis-trans isomerase
MRKKWIRGMLALIFGLLIAQAGLTAEVAPTQAPPGTVSAGEKPVLKTKKDKEIDLDIIIKGMKDVQTGNKLLLTEEEILGTLNIFASEVRRKQTEARLMVGEKNKKEGEEFLAANKTKEGVVTLPSGLQYKILKAGSGKKPTAEDTIEVHYRGTLVNGTQFESTYDVGKPATIKVSDPHVIAGLREAFKLMPVGSKWQVFIPNQLAYGQRGSGRVIGPYSTLIYEIEVLAIKDRPEAGKPAGQ